MRLPLRPIATMEPLSTGDVTIQARLFGGSGIEFERPDTAGSAHVGWALPS